MKLLQFISFVNCSSRFAGTAPAQPGAKKQSLVRPVRRAVRRIAVQIQRRFKHRIVRRAFARVLQPDRMVTVVLGGR